MESYVDLGCGCRDFWKYRGLGEIEGRWPAWPRFLEISSTKPVYQSFWPLEDAAKISRKVVSVGHWQNSTCWCVCVYSCRDMTQTESIPFPQGPCTISCETCTFMHFHSLVCLSFKRWVYGIYQRPSMVVILCCSHYFYLNSFYLGEWEPQPVVSSTSVSNALVIFTLYFYTFYWDDICLPVYIIYE